MNTKILVSLLVIGLTAIAIGGGMTGAFFSDTETSTGNFVRAGMIDLTVNGKNPLDSQVVTIHDMKPGYNIIITKNLTVTDNPSNVWMQITDVVGSQGNDSEPECKEENGVWDEVNDDCSNEQNPVDNLETQIYYDLTVCVDDGNGVYDNGTDNCTVIYSFAEKDKETLASLEGKWIQLAKNLSPDTMVWIFQSFHFNEEAGNEYQGDMVTFTENFAAYQLEAPGPTGTGTNTGILKMENKNPDTWEPYYNDSMNGTLEYNFAGPTFDYTFNGQGLQPNTEYCLIYYADCSADGWPGNCPGALIGNASTGSGTTLSFSDNKELNMDLPDPADYNYPAGAKIWLVPCADYDKTEHKMTAWNPTTYLFENDPVLINYDDTEVS